MSNHQTLTLPRILDLLAAVDAHLNVDVAILAGGGVAMMTIRSDRVSDDVDVLNRRLPEALTLAAGAVAVAEHLPADWLNNDAAWRAPQIPPERTSRLYRGRHLTVNVPDAESMLAMKLLAGRERDIHDVLALMDQTGITDADDLWRLVLDCFAGADDLATEVDWAYGHVAEACDAYEARQWLDPDTY